MLIRVFRPGDERILWGVYYGAVHKVACRDYSPAQLSAWCPDAVDWEQWDAKLRRLMPFVAESNGHVAGYADVQPDGLIDHFFVSAKFQRQGVGTALMDRIHNRAAELSLSEIHSYVSRTAQGFYERSGFAVIEHRNPVVRGVVVPNALMRKRLA